VSLDTRDVHAAGSKVAQAAAPRKGIMSPAMGAICAGSIQVR
jgi:hypothetical protein